jgi:hypothetical protein
MLSTVVEKAIYDAYDKSAKSNNGLIAIQVEDGAETKLVDRKTALQYVNACKAGEYSFGGITYRDNTVMVGFIKNEEQEWQI